MDTEQERAILLLAKAVTNLASALEKVKPDAIRAAPDSLLSSSFETDMALAKNAIADALKAMGVGRGTL